MGSFASIFKIGDISGSLRIFIVEYCRILQFYFEELKQQKTNNYIGRTVPALMQLHAYQRWCSCTRTSADAAARVPALLQLHAYQRWCSCTRTSAVPAARVPALVQLHAYQRWCSCTRISAGADSRVSALVQLQAEQRWCSWG